MTTLNRFTLRKYESLFYINQKASDLYNPGLNQYEIAVCSAAFVKLLRENK